MKWLAGLGLTALLSTSSVAAPTCPAKEYAQYKDAAKTAGGRISLGFGFCEASRNADQLVPGRARDQCVSEREKIGDALRAAKLHKVHSWALNGCQGDFPH